MIVPQDGYILVDRIKDTAQREETTKSGIVIATPVEARDDLIVSQGKILEVADNVKDFKKGEIVYYNYYSGSTLMQRGKDPLGKDDKTLFLVYKEDVMAKEL